MDLPPFAYVPGRTPRHHPAQFDALHASVRDDMTPDDLCQTRAWHAGLAYLDAGFFWEAHEALEPVWMQTQPASPERHLVQGIIQIANAALKERMGRPRAVRRLCDIAQSHLDACGASGRTIMGITPGSFQERIDDLRRKAIL